MAGDAVPEFMAQLEALPREARTLDLLLVSQGGDPTVAWRIVSLARARVDDFAVLIPQAAFSAATLIALGANQVVMHPHGNLGPVDPQIVSTRRRSEGQDEHRAFGSEDLAAFLRFAKEHVGLTDQRELLEVFKLFCDEVGAVGIGTAARSSQLSVSMGEKLLRLHMKEDGASKARSIAEALIKDFFHHGYPVNRSEARDIGLPISESDEELERLMWSIWTDFEGELKVRQPFNALTELSESPSAAILFGPVPQIQLPGNLPPAAAQEIVQRILQQVQVLPVPAVPFEKTHALMESTRLASRFTSKGRILAARLPDGQVRYNLIQERAGWEHASLEGKSETC